MVFCRAPAALPVGSGRLLGVVRFSLQFNGPLTRVLQVDTRCNVKSPAIVEFHEGDVDAFARALLLILRAGLMLLSRCKLVHCFVRFSKYQVTLGGLILHIGPRILDLSYTSAKRSPCLFPSSHLCPCRSPFHFHNLVRLSKLHICPHNRWSWYRGCPDGSNPCNFLSWSCPWMRCAHPFRYQDVVERDHVSRERRDIHTSDQDKKERICVVTNHTCTMTKMVCARQGVA